jgi:hypothetical protein
MHLLLRAGFLILVVFLSACRSAPPPDNPLELKTYEAPKGSVAALTSTIKDVLWFDEHKTLGRAIVTPDGRIAVLAPHNVQADVQDLIDEVKKHPPVAHSAIEIHYFLVIGKPGAAQPTPGAAEIQPALDEISRTVGPQTFTIAERVKLISLHDEQGRLDTFGDKLEVRQQGVQTADGVYAKLSIRWKEDKLETRVRLEPEKLLVLGASGLHGGDSPDGATLYYVVRLGPPAAR